MARSKTIRIYMCFLLSIFVHDKLQASISIQRILIVSILDWALGQNKVAVGKQVLGKSLAQKT